MSTLDQFRRGLNNIWDNIAEGWQQLRDSASNALTRFNPVTRKDDLQTSQDIAMLHGARWSVLAADVEESDDEVTVRLEVPGMEAGDFDIAVHEQYLVIRGEKQVAREHKSGRYHVSECAYGRFERAIPLPASVSEDQAQARYQRGVLTVSLPKIQPDKRRRIEVQHS
jgi:HSP20 family protein